MKKLLFLLVLLVPFSTFANTPDYTKNDACRLKDGYYEKTLNVSYPWYIASTFEFIKKWGKLVYFVHLYLNGDTTDSIYAYEYNCTTKKTREIGDSIWNGVYMVAWLEWVSENWIVAHKYPADWCWWVPNLKKTLVNRTTRNQKIVDFSQYSWFNVIIKKLNFKIEDMGIQTFGSTSNPNVFNAVLIRNDECGGDEYSGKNKTTKVVVDISKKTMTTTSTANANVSQTTNIKDYSISEDYRFYNGKVQFRSYINGVWRYQWSDTDIDATTMVFSSPINGKDKYGSFYAGIRLKMNGKNVFVEPIGATSKLSSLYFRDEKNDNVYVMGQGYGWLEILPFAKASTLITLSYGDNYDTYMSNIKNACNPNWDNSILYDITAIDSNFCYWTFGSTPGNNIEKKTERIK